MRTSILVHAEHGSIDLTCESFLRRFWFQFQMQFNRCWFFCCPRRLINLLLNLNTIQSIAAQLVSPLIFVRHPFDSFHQFEKFLGSLSYCQTKLIRTYIYFFSRAFNTIYHRSLFFFLKRNKTASVRVKEKQSSPATLHGGSWGRGGIAPTHSWPRH
jgi:hypothetical protein